MDEGSIARFWEAHPCGDHQVAGLDGDHEAFFQRYDAHRYRTEPHIPRCLDAMAVRGKRVLEIGLGQGADSEQLIRRGARWSGVDLTGEAVRRVAMRLDLRQLAYESLGRASALQLPFPDGAFDLVYSHGVLHHIPDIDRAQREIARVLRPQGELFAMVYAKRSLNYGLSIRWLRRLGLVGLVASGTQAPGHYGEHARLAREQGLRTYLQMDNFIHRNTDGPHNPYSKVYDEAELRRDFGRFALLSARQEHLHAPPLRFGPLTRAHGTSVVDSDGTCGRTSAGCSATIRERHGAHCGPSRESARYPRWNWQSTPVRMRPSWPSGSPTAM